MHRLYNILVVDDEKEIASLIKEALSDSRHAVFSTTSFSEACSILESQAIDLVLVDLFLGKKSGEEIFNKAKELHPDVVVILMTGQPTLENAISVLKSGAYDYLVKPFTVPTLKAVVKRGLEKQKLARENMHLKEQVALLKISEAMGQKIKLDGLLNLILDFVIKEYEADFASLILLNEKTGQPELKNYKGFSTKFLQDSFLVGKDKISHKVINLAKPLIVNETSLIDQYLPKGLKKQIKSLISYPLLAKGKVIGILNLIRCGKLSVFTEGELKFLSVIASKAGSAIENSRLYENLQETYWSTISALANAVEARDVYTRGHTERVWYIACTIAKKLGWKDRKLEEVKMGGILHDIGKIGVPDYILNKPTSLTSEEFAIMKMHPILGSKMLEEIASLKPALPYVLYHHERYDGKGYPFGLCGEKIPIEGRLLAVVDTFDAITSDRPYRKNKGYKKALEEIKIYAGTQFDPKIAKIFLEAWENGEIELHRLEIESVDAKVFHPEYYNSKVGVRS